jgi:hypothetical protein
MNSSRPLADQVCESVIRNYFRLLFKKSYLSDYFGILHKLKKGFLFLFKCIGIQDLFSSFLRMN